MLMLPAAEYDGCELSMLKLVAGWFKMSRRPGLPGDRGLFGLLHQATQADFSGTEEFRIIALHECSEKHEKRSIVPGCQQEFVQDWVCSS